MSANKTLPYAQQQLDGTKLTAALGFQSTWVISAIKKANAIFAAQGKEDLIFTGRYSTPAKVTKWLDAHPGFVASHVLITPEQQLVYRARKAQRRLDARVARQAAGAEPMPGKHRPRRPIAA